MNAPQRDAIVVLRARDLEVVPLREGGAEVIAARTRRMRLTPDALWLLERLEGRPTVEDVASELSARFGRTVNAPEAADVLQRTLVAHGVATFAPASGTEASPPLVRARRQVLVGAPDVQAFARALAWTAAPEVALPLLAGTLAALAMVAARIAAAGAAPWRSPEGWALALPLALAGFLVHELAHAVALARAGGRPGAIAIVRGAGRVRLATDLAGLDALPARSRAAIDVAGAAAQLVLAAVVGGGAVATGGMPPAPALAILVALALLELLPLPGTDGRWLLDDLAGRDPGDTLRRRVPPARWLSRAAARIVARVEFHRGRGPLAEMLPLLPVFVSASFPRWPARRLRAHAMRHMESAAVAMLDHHDLARAARADEVRHVRAVRALRAARRGAVVCGMHVGPYQFVPGTLAELGCAVAAYAAPNQQGQYAADWSSGAHAMGARFEMLSPRSVRDAVRAVRMVREGGMLYLLMDGQAASSRDQHRADFRFLGNDLYMRTGPAVLARKAGAPLLLAATWYEGVARRVVEFSDPFPPPQDDSEAALVARTAELYAWFEARVARDPAQWDGWVWPLSHWRSTGRAPTATAAELEAALGRATRALAGEPRGARIAADPTRVQWTQWNGEHLVVHGPERRVLVATPLTCRVLDAAFRRERIAGLPASTGAAPEALAPELARLTLAQLAAMSD